ncbi:Early light-induced protein 1, chloroplastic [Apostasia shenzhenica]|uniref:Early light-induced protein 1, chloroplastic n=1 Tax=Apostasia shenzhenica TaxID=1088818 RepID=A0A2I0BAX9_9ASPA|nr:Early light-induced protein 1, chloroplastic [Apostasia shenzhenica]
MATVAYALSTQSFTAGFAPRGKLSPQSPALLLAGTASWCRRSAAADASLTVRCQAAENGGSEIEPPTSAKIPSPTSEVQPKVKGTSLWDALAFSGPAPERINGRLAMIGFASALAVEVARGDDLAAQLANGGLLWFAGSTVLLSVASLVPLLRGVDAPERSGGIMTADAELWNGRFAMLGLMGLALTEFLTGGPLV